MRFIRDIIATKSSASPAPEEQEQDLPPWPPRSDTSAADRSDHTDRSFDAETDDSDETSFIHPDTQDVAEEIDEIDEITPDDDDDAFALSSGQVDDDESWEMTDSDQAPFDEDDFAEAPADEGDEDDTIDFSEFEGAAADWRQKLTQLMPDVDVSTPDDEDDAELAQDDLGVDGGDDAKFLAGIAAEAGIQPSRNEMTEAERDPQSQARSGRPETKVLFAAEPLPDDGYVRRFNLDDKMAEFGVTADQDDAAAIFDDASDDIRAALDMAETRQVRAETRPEPAPRAETPLAQSPVKGDEPTFARVREHMKQQQEDALIASMQDDSGPPPDAFEVPAPAIGRSSRRAARVKTRLLGFDNVADDSVSPFDRSTQADEEERDQRFPVGWLVVIGGPGLGNAVTLFNGVSQIGRGPDQGARLDFGDNSISRNNHAAIAYDIEQKQFFLGHGGKANLVRLNNTPVLSTETLTNGDEIRIGETTLRFVALCGNDFDWTSYQEDDADHAAFG